MENFFAVIMAGGKGERLWPLSREKKPKPFIEILDKPLINLTYNRLKKIVPEKNIIVIVPSYLANLTKKYLPGVKILKEPFPRNTLATCIYSTFYIYKKSKDAVIGIFPADHIIKDEKNFKRIVNFAFKNVKDSILTFGIKPNRPETGYGYIELGNSLYREDNLEIREVLRFHEKPDKEKALNYLKRGNFMWNSGIFIFKAESFFNILKEANSSIYDLLKYLENKKVKKFFEMIPETSIDYGVLEKTNRLSSIPADFGWEDLGSFLSFENVLPRDKEGNTSKGNPIFLDSKNNIVFSKGKKIIFYKIENLAFIDSGDIILIFPKYESQKIKELLKELKKIMPKKYF
ncbi:MAG: sugar phosphate nucleotidyltransferase [candidate division WOR-3 bacterium]